MDSWEFLAIGHVTLDLLEGASMLGGAAYYGSRTAAALGLRSALWTSVGPDFPHRDELALAGIGIERVPAAQTTHFENRYGPQGRSQRLLASSAELSASELPVSCRTVPVVYLCPVMAEVSLEVIRALQSPLVGLGAQGWMRQVESTGAVRPRRWRPSAEQLSGARLVVLSDEDAAGDAGLVPWLESRIELVAYTHGARGADLFVAGQRHEIPAYPTKQLGPTGAGDVFGAAMLTGLHRGLSAVQAAQLASCAASIAVEAPGGAALDRLTESWDRLESYGRVHGLSVAQPTGPPLGDVR